MMRSRNIALALVATSAFSLSLSGASEPKTVAERYFTSIDAESNVDSIAVWDLPRSPERWLIATSKAQHTLHVYDAKNGYPISVYGGFGTELGQLNRPNGIAVIDKLLLVVERDNHRVQVLSLPDFAPIGTFGDSELIKPYGLYVRKTGKNGYQVYVSDDFNKDPAEKPEPNPEGVRKRIKQYDIGIDSGDLSASLLKSFGEFNGSGALDVVESLTGDETYDRLMVADEDETHGMEIHVFDLNGNDTGKRLGLGLFKFQPEGIALWETSSKAGYWIFTDQGKVTNYYHIFDRETLDYRASFQGERTLNTDGVAIDLKPSARYPMGLFYAIHDDSGIAAWSIADIAKTLKLR